MKIFIEVWVMFDWFEFWFEIFWVLFLKNHWGVNGKWLIFYRPIEFEYFSFYVGLVKIGEGNTKTDLGFYEKMTK